MGGFCRGLDITLEFDPRAWQVGGLYLLASVLERFLALHGTVNSFTRTRASLRGRPGLAARLAGPQRHPRARMIRVGRTGRKARGRCPPWSASRPKPRQGPTALGTLFIGVVGGVGVLTQCASTPTPPTTPTNGVQGGSAPWPSSLPSPTPDHAHEGALRAGPAGGNAPAVPVRCGGTGSGAGTAQGGPGRRRTFPHAARSGLSAGGCHGGGRNGAAAGGDGRADGSDRAVRRVAAAPIRMWSCSTRRGRSLALHDFLDMLGHRFVAFFARAGMKYRPARDGRSDRAARTGRSRTR